jgi:hypothetical protein
MNHSEHYPTFIENPKTHARVAVKTPYDHHRQLLAWKQPGLDPVPAAPVDPVAEQRRIADPIYPMMVEHPKSGVRVRVEDAADHQRQLNEWANPKKPSAPAPPAPPPARPLQSTGAAKAGATTKTSGAKGGLQPPTVEELMKKGYQKGLATRMADEEIRKFNAGEAPYKD